MIDIHAHILPGIDDGAGNIETSMNMAQVALNSGVSTVIATPHCNIPGTAANYKGEELFEIYEMTCEKLYRRNMPLQLLLGAEVFATPDLPYKIEKNMIPTLHDSEYMLIEFPFDSEPGEMFDILNNVKAAGIKPVIAHPERYPFVQRNPYIMLRIVEEGYHMQINKGSISGKFGRNAQAAVHFALQKRLASFAASDAHSVARKSASLSGAADYISEFFSRRYANEILFENPRRIIEGKKVPHPQPR